VKPEQVDSTTPQTVISGHCQGADIKRWFAILLRHHGNITVEEMMQ